MDKTVEAVFRGLGELAMKFQAHPEGAKQIVTLAAVVAVIAAFALVAWVQR